MLRICAATAAVLWLGCGGAAATAKNAGAGSDSPFIVEHWTVRDGLPQSSVLSVIQTRDGYLWVGTGFGLARFDGVRFKVFDEANTPGLSSSRVDCLFEDSRSNLWFGSGGAGITAIGSDGRVRNWRPQQDNSAGLRAACEDSSGSIWFRMEDRTLARFDGSRVESVPGQYQHATANGSGPLWLALEGYDPQQQTIQQRLVAVRAAPGTSAFVVEQELPVRHLDYIVAAANGGYWRFANKRIQRWSASTMEQDWGAYPWSPSTYISCACTDREGNLIVGTYEGVFLLRGNGQFTRVGSAEGLSHNTVLSLCVDNEGNLWVGTDGGGLNRVRRKAFTVQEGTRWLTIQSVCEDGQGGLWYANFGGLLSFWNEGRLQQFGTNEGLRDLNVRSVFVDHRQTVWVGTTLDGLFRRQGQSFMPATPSQPGLNVSVIFEDRAGQLWIGTADGLARREGEEWRWFTTADGLSANDVRAIAEDAEGNLWVGTEGGGLNRLRDGRFTAWRKGQTDLPSDSVSALCAGSKGVLWIGTRAGLARLEHGRCTRYTTAEGLAGNGVASILEDGDDLWIASYSGVMRVSIASLDAVARGATNSVYCRVYAEADGLPTRECSQGSQPTACRSQDGRIWFATIQGLVSTQPAELKRNQFEAPLVIESVLLDGREQKTNAFSRQPLDGVVVPPRRKRLEIQFASLNLGAADRATFQYRLRGHEEDWTPAGNSRVARYSHLSPGRYRFEVQACNEDGVWSRAGAALAVWVQPPFWQAWWFRGSMAALLLVSIVGTVRYFSTQKLQRQLAGLRQREALEKERARIARDLHDQLGANLTQVALLGELAETDKTLPAEVETHARQISQTARETTQALDEIVWAVNPSNDTLDGLITYACKYAQEYLELAGIRYRLEIPPGLPPAVVAPEVRHNVFLAFKEAVNNVVKHAQATSAWIRLRAGTERFELEIEDDGRGLGNAGETAGRNGLRNMRKRMQDVGGAFSIGPAASGQGTVVRLSAPLRNQ